MVCVCERVRLRIVKDEEREDVEDVKWKNIKTQSKWDKYTDREYKRHYSIERECKMLRVKERERKEEWEREVQAHSGEKDSAIIRFYAATEIEK